jgi:hypothetical protein
MSDTLSAISEVTVAAADEGRREGSIAALKSIELSAYDRVILRRIESLKSRLFLKYMLIDDESLTRSLHLTDTKGVV